MKNAMTLAVALLALGLATGASGLTSTQTAPAFTPQAPAQSTLPLILAAGPFDNSSLANAICLYEGERYPGGSRLCIGGVWNICNARGLWEPTGNGC